MSLRRMMIFTLGAKIKSLIQAFKERVLSSQGEFEGETCLNNTLEDMGIDLFDQASLVFTPNGYKENVLYSIKPNDTASNFTTTRATTGTRVNSDGLIEDSTIRRY